MAWERRQVINIEDDELKDFKKLSWSDFINLSLSRALKSEGKEQFALEVDKLESLLSVELPNEYYDSLKGIEDAPNKKPYTWRKFELLLKYVRKRTPVETVGEL